MNQEERIEYFMAEIARLSNQVVDLQDERDALSAQVEALKAAIDGVRKVGKTSGFGVPSPASVRAERLAWLRLAEVVELSPQHHLRQVRSDAGRDGFIAGYMLCNDDSPLIKHNYEGFANQYHASILAGKE